MQIPKRGGGRVERRLRRDAIAKRLLEHLELPPYVCTVHKGLVRMNFIHPVVDDVIQTLSTHYPIFSPPSALHEHKGVWVLFGYVFIEGKICQANMKNLDNLKA